MDQTIAAHLVSVQLKLLELSGLRKMGQPRVGNGRFDPAKTAPAVVKVGTALFPGQIVGRAAVNS